MEIKEAFQGKQKEWAKVIAQAWADEGFKKRLLTDPRSVLKENGIDLPESIKLSISEGKEDEINLILPPKPSDPLISTALYAEQRLAAGSMCTAGYTFSS